jgi:ATP-dependent Clp protease ATP-binding subunit ClpA
VLGRQLRPELLARIQRFVEFESLDERAIRTIAEKVFEGARERAEARGITLPNELRKQVLGNLPAVQFGAREIERYVIEEVARWLQERQQLVMANTIDPSSNGNAGAS